MASSDFTGVATTTILAYDSNWKANTGNDAGNLTLDGSGNLRNPSAFPGYDYSYQNGSTDQSSKSRIVVLAGVRIDNGIATVGPSCRATTTNRGYRAWLRSSTELNTNLDKIDIYRDGSYMGTVNPTTINANTTAIDVSIQVVNTRDIQVVINGQTLTLAGSGANDASGAAPFTGGFPGLFLYNNNAAAANTALITSWTDDVTAGTTVSPSPATITVNGRAATTSAFTNVRIREVLVNNSGQPVGGAANLSLLVWYGGRPIGAPDVSLNGLTTDAAGTTSWSIATGALSYNQSIFYLACGSDSSLSAWTCARMTPSYE